MKNMEVKAPKASEAEKRMKISKGLGNISLLLSADMCNM